MSDASLPSALGLIPVVALLQASSCFATARTPAHGELLDVLVHGPSLEGNLLHLSAERAVSIYLPPSYRESRRPYPVLYLLHGIMDSYRTWTQGWDETQPGFATIQDLMDRGIERGWLQEMIVVIPDADKTCHYTDSPVKGGWGSFIATDLVGYVDRTYRTIPEPGGRGVLGHSMGGHGALKLAMTHPGVFGVIYAMNPSMLGWGGDVSADNPSLAGFERLRSPDDLARADFYVQAVVGIGQCFSPRADAPLLTDAPFVAAAGGKAVRGPGWERWNANMPITMAPQHVAELKALRALRFDSAFEDEFTHIPITARALDGVLDSLGVAHTFEMYNGDHRNRLWGEHGRLFTEALPWFSSWLGREAIRTATPAAAQKAEGEAIPAAQVQLWKAAVDGDLAAARAALAAGADLNALDTRTTSSGRRALHYAAENDRAEMIRWLVASGADVNLPNKTGFTPLHHAAESGSSAAAEILLELGADPKAELPSGSTPLDVARQRRKAEVARVLEKASGN